MQSFELMQNMDQNTQVKYRKALLEYCKLDTLAMVKNFKTFRRNYKILKIFN